VPPIQKERMEESDGTVVCTFFHRHRKSGTENSARPSGPNQHQLEVSSAISKGRRGGARVQKGVMKIVSLPDQKNGLLKRNVLSEKVL